MKNSSQQNGFKDYSIYIYIFSKFNAIYASLILSGVGSTEGGAEGCRWRGESNCCWTVYLVLETMEGSTINGTHAESAPLRAKFGQHRRNWNDGKWQFGRDSAAAYAKRFSSSSTSRPLRWDSWSKSFGDATFLVWHGKPGFNHIHF